MLTFTSTGRRLYVNQSPGSTFRAAPSAGGGGMCPVFMNTNGINQDFCVIAWVKPGWSGSSQYTIFGMDKAFTMKSASGNVLDCRLAAVDGTIAAGGANQATQALVVSTAGALVLGEWNLVAMSYNNTSAVLTATVINSANPSGSAANSAAYSTSRPTQANDCPSGMSIGGGQGFADWQGTLGTVAFMNRTCSLADLQAIWAAKQYLGPWRYMVDTYNPSAVVAFNVSIPGTILDESGAAIGSLWLVAGTTTTGTSGAAPPGWNYIDTGRTAGTSQNTHRPNWINNVGANTARFDSHDGETFFTRSTVAGAAAPGGVGGPSTLLAAMYATVAGRHFGIVASNSRGVRRPSAGGQTVPERHSEGYMQAVKAKVGGILNGRPWLSSTEATNAFGLRIAQGATVQSSGTGRTLHTSTGYVDLTRAWTGGDANSSSSPASSQGQGHVLDSTGCTFGLKFTPESGSLFLATKKMRVRYHILRYPGSCASVQWKAVKSADQNTGTDITSNVTLSGLDTTVTSDAIQITDTYNAGSKTLTLSGVDLIARGVVPDHIFFNGTTKSAAQIATINKVGSDTVIVFKTALAQAPQTGDAIYFGPWSTTTIEYEFAALAGGDSQVNRGLVLTAGTVSSSGGGVVLLGMDAWNSEDPDMIVLGHAGYSGNGYAIQLSDCWTGMLPNFYRKMFDASMSVADAKSFSVFLHHADQQVASPGLYDYAGMIVNSVPECAVSYMGDQVHAVDADVINWDTSVLGQSSRLAVTVTGDSRLGTLMEQWAAGHRTDSSHPSALGMLRCSEANIARGGPLASLQSRSGAAGRGSAGRGRGQSIRATRAAVSAVAVLDELL